MGKRVQHLLRHRAKISIEDNSGRTPIQQAFSDCFPDETRVEMAADLLNNGANVDSIYDRDEEHMLLYQAVITGNHKMVILLFSRSADRMIEDSGNKTAIEYAEGRRTAQRLISGLWDRNLVVAAEFNLIKLMRGLIDKRETQTLIFRTTKGEQH
jgi:hypothetical protein